MLLNLVLASILLPAHQPAGPPPRAFAGPSGRVALASGWRYAADPADLGRAAGWARGGVGAGGTRVRVRLPHVANPGSTAAGASLPAAQRAFRGSVGWYERELRVPVGGTYAVGLDSAAFRGDAWIDGRRLGGHTGAHLPWEVRARLRPGRHRLVVRVDWRSPAGQAAAGYGRTWFNFGGLNGEVTLRRLGRSEVGRPVVRTQLLADGAAGGALRARPGARVTVRARVVNRARVARVLRPVGRLGRSGDDGLVLRFPARRLAAGAAATFTARASVPWGGLWSPGRPVLQELAVGIPGESGYRARVGLRELAWSGGRLRVNGRAVVLRGASLHEDVPGRGDALSLRDMDATVARLRTIGANATRVQHALAPALMERLDRAGIMVWQQLGPVDRPGRFAAGTDAALRARASSQVRQALRAGALHPAIVGWSLGTEVAGAGAPGQASWVAATARELHRRDPGRPVGVDVWKDLLPVAPGELYRELDAIGTTSYFGWYERTGVAPRDAARSLRRRLLRFRERLPGRLLLAAELGAEGTPDAARGALGGTGYQAALVGTQLRALARTPDVDGAFVWILRDFAVNPAFGGGSVLLRAPGLRLLRGHNQKGLFTAAGHPKPAALAVRDALRAFPPTP
jgi:hypothetical protein